MSDLTLQQNPMTTVSNAERLWRALAFAIAAAGAAVVLVWVWQSRSATNAALTNTIALDVTQRQVTVSGGPADGASVAVLGIDRSLQTPVVNGAAALELPSRQPALVGLFTDGQLIGLSLTEGAGSTDVAISATSTARALLTLSPAGLLPDPIRGANLMQRIEQDDAFSQLVAALSLDPVLSVPNPGVESALASILDRWPARIGPPDQGCDSVINQQAFAAVGACLQPTNSGVSIANEQDRWALLFAGPEPYGAVCAAVAPERSPGSERTVSVDDCGTSALMAAPGPIVDRSPTQAPMNDRVALAAAVDLYASYVAPFADLTAGAAGLNRSSNGHVFDRLEELAAFASELSSADPSFAAALAATNSSTTPVERHRATITVAQAMLSSDQVGAVIEGWEPEEGVHAELLGLMDRAADLMVVADRSDWRWTAESSAVVPIGPAS